MISRWTVLASYSGLCALFALAVWHYWRRALDPRAAAIEAVQLDTHELAMLAGGPQLAITSAAVTVRSKLVAQPGRGPRTFLASGDLGADAAELERELFDAVRRARGISAQELLRELPDCEPMRRLTARLTQAGLLQDGRVVSRLRRWRLPGAALVMVGLAVVVIVGRDGEPDAVALAAAMTAAVASLTVSLARARPTATGRGRALLEQVRETRSDLRAHPHGAELPLAVALFGCTAAWAADADFAAAWGATAQPGLWWSGGHYACGGCGGCGGCG
ncbi:MAG: TIGR04222 domain-containing membrane protein [Solirubrobacteraceae bacterium]